MWLTGYCHGVGFLYVLFQQLPTAEGRSACLTLETLYIRPVSLVMLHEFLLCREGRATRFTPEKCAFRKSHRGDPSQDKAVDQMRDKAAGNQRRHRHQRRHQCDHQWYEEDGPNCDPCQEAEARRTTFCLRPKFADLYD